MKFTVILLVLSFSCLLISFQVEGTKSTALMIPTQSSHAEEWEWITKYLATIMTNSQIMHENAKLEVTVFLLSQPKWNREYEGFQSSLSKFLRRDIVTTSISFARLRPDLKADFVIIFTTPEPLNYRHLVKDVIRLIFISRHTKFFIIVRNWYDRNKIVSLLWTELTQYRYLNVYVALEINYGSFFIYHTSFVSNGRMSLIKIESDNVNDKLMTVKDTLTQDIRISINILAFNSFPSSFVINNKVYGADGYLIDEFVRKINASYRNVHAGDKNPSIPQIISYMSGLADICLCAHYNFEDAHLETIWLYEIDGVCLLAPRNIHVSSYESFSSGMDRTTIILAIVTSVLVFICWKIIMMFSEHRMSTLEIFFAVVGLAFFNSSFDLNRLSLKEKFLVFSFMFASFFMSNLYESSITSFMMTDTTVRSARDIEELNNTDTKFYLYYDDKTVFNSDLPQVRKELILSYEKIDEDSGSLNMPHDFDENLVYMVTCGFAGNFVKSPRNYRNNQRLYDILIMTQSYQFYTVRNGFIFIDEFSSLVTASIESGIRSYWTRETYRQSEDFGSVIKNDVKKERQLIEILVFPIIVFLVGTFLSLLEFIAEYVYHHIEFVKSRRSQITLLKSQSKSKRINLRKWINKYSRKNPRCCKMSKILSSREHVTKVIMNKKREIMKREKFPEGKLKGGYLVPKKLKQRTGRRIIKVVPINSDIMETNV